MIGVLFLGVKITYDLRLCDVFALGGQDVMEFDGAEGVHSINALLEGCCRILANALAEASEFICIGCVPNVFEFGVLAELSVTEFLSHVRVDDSHCQVLNRCGIVAVVVTVLHHE